MSKSDRLLWTALAVSTAAHVSLFWTPDLGWALDPPITTRDIAFLLDNMTPAGSRAPAGDPDQVERGAGVSPAPPAPPASPASPETGQAETPAPRGAGVPPAPPAPAGGPISDDPAAQGRLKALEEAAKVWDLDRPDAEGPRRRYVDQVRDKISAQYFIPEAARRQKMKGLVRLQAEVRRDGTIVKIQYLERSDFPVLDAAAKLAVQRAAPFPSLEGVVDFETLRLNIPIKY